MWEWQAVTNTWFPAIFCSNYRHGGVQGRVVLTATITHYFHPSLCPFKRVRQNFSSGLLLVIVMTGQPLTVYMWQNDDRATAHRLHVTGWWKGNRSPFTCDRMMKGQPCTCQTTLFLPQGEIAYFCLLCLCWVALNLGSLNISQCVATHWHILNSDGEAYGMC